MNRFTWMITAAALWLAAGAEAAVLKANDFQHYVDRFNADDEEMYANIANKDAWTFLNANIPLFACPDPDFERTYYFRWWTYRKHVKQTSIVTGMPFGCSSTPQRYLRRR